MKDVLFFVFLLAIVAVLLYYGQIFIIQKGLGSSRGQLAPMAENQGLIKKQQEEAQDLLKKQRLMMEAQKQKIRDLQRR